MTNAEVFPPFRAAQPAGAEPVKQAKKTRVAKVKVAKPAGKAKKLRKPRPVSLSLAVLPALAGMSPDDAALLASIVNHLQGASKRSRVKIVAALGKVFR